MKTSFSDTATAYAYKTNGELQNANFIFSTVNHPLLCSIATNAVKLGLKIKLPIDWIIKKTVFSHFCGGDTIKNSYGVVVKLAASGVGTILDYSVEGATTELGFDATASEILKTIDNAKASRHVPFAVFKMTGIASANLLEKIQNNTNLSDDEQQAYNRIEERVDKICREAQQADVPILIDAEESWIQETIDSLVYKMMAKYNGEKTVVFNTYQLYRTTSLMNLQNAYQLASENNYHLGAKLVRGAYMEKERERAVALGYPSPIQPDLNSTNNAFNNALKFCIENISQISMICGSHNEESNRYLTELMSQHNIEYDDPRVWFSQLYGMSDNISFNLAKSRYNVAKYVPYGPVTSVMPYLLRRAAENTSVAGQSSRELRMVRAEIRRRKLVKARI
jgi:proline dehydrogenase